MQDGDAAIDAVLAYIHDCIAEPLSLRRLADYAGYSPFHFSRLFKACVGVSPQRYVASLRLHRAKELLLTTDLPVREICLEVGQQSLGTFTTQFAARVGLPPAHFRESEEKVESELRSLLSIDLCEVSRRLTGLGRPLTGTVSADTPIEGMILLGLFRTPIAEGVPSYSTMLFSPGDFCFPNVQPGTYYLVGTTIAHGMRPSDILLRHATLRIIEPIVVKLYCRPPHLNVQYTPPKPGDPPVLVSLPFLMTRFLRQVAQFSKKKEIP